MKKTLAYTLALLLLASSLNGCAGNNTSDANDTGDISSPSEEQSISYEYLFRDLPNATYVTPAAEFAGGDGSEASPYQISNAAELALLHEKLVYDTNELKDGYINAHYILTADISLNDTTGFTSWETTPPQYSWMPIGSGIIGSFDGVFDGNGHTVSGMYINTNAGTEEENDNNNFGLFDSVGGTVKNLKIDSSFIEVSGRSCAVGSVAGLLEGTGSIESCSSNAVIRCYDSETGGIVGKTQSSTIGHLSDEEAETEVLFSTVSDCSFSGTISQIRDNAMSYMGGIIGACSGDILSCTNTGALYFTSRNIDSAGGIAGRVNEGNISECKNEGILKCEPVDENAYSMSGGIAGKIFVSSVGGEKYMSRGVKITSCENTGTVEGHIYAGGIAGELANDHNDYCVTISDCINNGTVSSNKYTGGIIGHVNCIGDNENGDSIVIENCQNNADISKGSVGGIISNFMSETGDVRIKNCRNTGNLTSDDQHCAGIIAYWLMNSMPANTSILVEDCENTGNIASSLNAGGIISYMDMPVCLEMGKNVEITVKGCNNSGSVTTDKVNGYIGGILANWGMKDISTVIDNCTNSGNLSITAAADGITEDEEKIMTISRIAGGIVGRVGEGLLLTTDHDTADNKNVQSDKAVLRITDSHSTGELSVVNENAEFYKNWFGGIIGNTCGEDGFSVYVEDCTYTGFERGLGNEDLTDVGTKK